ncbi:hypothetical protein VTN49DRAFT_2582 [Thermomyces lanuginosus]|uniref:uncharacterized protein n=1 Tax=Thermomyces lanuginosus TaxID=5541 RepID=UPI0037447081
MSRIREWKHHYWEHLLLGGPHCLPKYGSQVPYADPSMEVHGFSNEVQLSLYVVSKHTASKEQVFEIDMPRPSAAAQLRLQCLPLTANAVV